MYELIFLNLYLNLGHSVMQKWQYLKKSVVDNTSCPSLLTAFALSYRGRPVASRHVCRCVTSSQNDS